MFTRSLDLHEAIAAVCPIEGITVRDAATKDVIVGFSKSATPEQIAAGKAALAAFDWDAKSKAETAEDDAKEARAWLADNFGKLTEAEQKIVIALKLR